MLGRVLVLIGALLVAIIGTGLVFLYVEGAKAKAIQDAPGTNVYVALDNIDPDTTIRAALKDQLLGLEKVTPRAQVDGALSESELTTDLLDKAITKGLPQGEQLVLADLEPAGGSDSLDLGPDGAVQLQIGDPERVSGYVVPGSFVAVYVTFDPQVVGNEATCTQLLIDKTEVLEIGTAPAGAVDPATGLPAVSTNTNVTLRVPGTSDLGQRLIQAHAEGSLYFMLVGEDSELLPPETPYAGSERCLTSADLARDPISAGKETVAPPPTTAATQTVAPPS